MNRMLQGAFALAILGTACSAPAEEASSAASDIVNGVDAFSAELDAIGEIRAKFPGQDEFAGSCTGTLVAADLVVTARHCVRSDGSKKTMLQEGVKMLFAIGADGNKPKQTIDVASVDICALSSGGAMKLGCDVALLHLAKPVNGVTPFRLAAGPIPADLVGSAFAMIGYGYQDAGGIRYDTRKAGTTTLRAVTGKPYPTVFPTLDDFLAEVEVSENVEFRRDLYEEQYKDKLLSGYEAYVGGPEDATTCHGDSGGPLLRNESGKLVVYGVVSGGLGGKNQVCLNTGTIYATFGADAQKLFDTAGVR